MVSGNMGERQRVKRSNQPAGCVVVGGTTGGSTGGSVMGTPPDGPVVGALVGRSGKLMVPGGDMSGSGIGAVTGAGAKTTGCDHSARWSRRYLACTAKAEWASRASSRIDWYCW